MRGFTFLLTVVSVLGMARLGAAQSVRWERTFSGKGAAGGISGCATPDGGFVAAGGMVGSRGGDATDSTRGDEDMWIIKYDAAGNKQWDRCLGGPRYDDCWSVKPTRDGGYILGGYCMSGRGGDHSEPAHGDAQTGDINYDLWVVKVDAQGRKQWDRSLGTDSLDQYRTCIQTADGNYLVVAYSDALTAQGSKTQPNHGADDVWLIKLSATGAVLWDRTLGGSGGDVLHDATPTADGGCILVGETDSPVSGDVTQASPVSPASDDVWVVKVDANGVRQWDRRYGGLEQDVAESIVATTDGGYIVSGTSESGVSGSHSQPSRGLTDYWVLKLTATGFLEWERRFGTNEYEFHTCVVQLTNGTYVVAGSTSGGINGDKQHPQFGPPMDYDIWAVGFSATGALLWEQPYGGSAGDVTANHFLFPTLGGGFRLVGGSESPVSGNRTSPLRGAADLWVVQADANGTKTGEWAASPISDEVQQAVLQTADGSLLMAGQSVSAKGYDRIKDLSTTARAWWLVQRDSLGAVRWDSAYSFGYQENVLRSVQVSRDQGLLLGGTALLGDISCGTNLDPDFLVAKVRGTSPDWNKKFGGPGDDYLAEARQTTDLGFVLGGTSRSGIGRDKSEASRGSADFWLLKLNTARIKLWDHRYGGTGLDSLVSVRQTADGGYLLAGSTTSPSGGDITEAGRGGADYWLVKVSSLGVLQWQHRYGGPANDWLAAARPTPDGGYLLLGTTVSGTGGEITTPGRGKRDLWAVKVNSLGVLQWQRRYGGTGNEYAATLEVDPDGGYILGASTDSPISGEVTQASRGGTDYWLLRIGAGGTPAWDKRLGGSGEDVLTCLTTTRGYGYAVGGQSNSPTASGEHQQANKGGYDYWTLVLGARRVLGTAAAAVANQLALYPNPSTGTITVSLTGLQAQPAVPAELLNTLGQVVHTQALPVRQGAVTELLDLGHCPAGVYWLRLSLAEGPVVQPVVRQ